MHATETQLVLGVDAGGTKTTAWLARYTRDAPDSRQPQSLCDAVQIIGQGAAGPGNPRAIGFEAAAAAIQEAIAAAYAQSDAAGETAAGEPAAAACLAVAGAGRREEQQRLYNLCMQHNVARQMQVIGDAVPVLAAACGHLPAAALWPLRGVALIAGTGSMAWGCNTLDAAGHLKQSRVGGWGYVLGDEGSGYWIGLAALRAVCRAADGMAPPTELTHCLLHALGLSEPTELIGKIYGAGWDRRHVAGLAPLVVQLATPGSSRKVDAVAAEIVAHAAQELAALVRQVAQQLGLDQRPVVQSQPPIALALAGGVLTGSQFVCSRLQAELADLPLEPIVVPSPVLGAVYLAAAELA